MKWTKQNPLHEMPKITTTTNIGLHRKLDDSIAIDECIKQAQNEIKNDNDAHPYGKREKSVWEN